MLAVDLKACIFQLNNSFFPHKDGVAIGSILIMANICMCHFEDKHLKECDHPYIPVFLQKICGHFTSFNNK